MQKMRGVRNLGTEKFAKSHWNTFCNRSPCLCNRSSHPNIKRNGVLSVILLHVNNSHPILVNNKWSAQGQRSFDCLWTTQTQTVYGGFRHPRIIPSFPPDSSVDRLFFSINKPFIYTTGSSVTIGKAIWGSFPVYKYCATMICCRVFIRFRSNLYIILCKYMDSNVYNSTVALSGFTQCKYNFELSTRSSVTCNRFRCVKRQWRSSQSSQVQKVHRLLESMCEKRKWWSSQSSKSSTGHPKGNRTIVFYIGPPHHCGTLIQLTIIYWTGVL